MVSVIMSEEQNSSARSTGLFSGSFFCSRSFSGSSGISLCLCSSLSFSLSGSEFCFFLCYFFCFCSILGLFVCETLFSLFLLLCGHGNFQFVKFLLTVVLPCLETAICLCLVDTQYKARSKLRVIVAGLVFGL